MTAVHHRNMEQEAMYTSSAKMHFLYCGIKPEVIQGKHANSMQKITPVKGLKQHILAVNQKGYTMLVR